MVKITCFFELLQQKPCRIIYKFRQNTIFGPETCEIGPTVLIWTCPELPRPVQEDKYSLQASGNTFIFSDVTPFHFSLANSSFLIKSFVLLSNFITFYKIICFIKQIYHFYKIISSLREFIFFIKS